MEEEEAKNRSFENTDKQEMNRSNHVDRSSEKKKSQQSNLDKPKAEDLRISTEMNKSAIVNQEDHHTKSGIHDISTSNHNNHAQPENPAQNKSPLKSSEIFNKSLEKSQHEELENMGNLEEMEEKEVDQDKNYKDDPVVENNNEEDMEPKYEEKQIEDEYNDKVDMSNREFEEN